MTNELVRAYQAATSKLLLFDYDGVLAPIVVRPELAAPTEQVRTLLTRLAADAATTVVIVSGRDRETLEHWLGDLPVDMSAEHGHFIKQTGQWQPQFSLDLSWREDVRRGMQALVDEYPGSHIETKQASLVWHYRQVEGAVDEAAAIRAIRAAAGRRAEVMPGKCVIDVRVPGADKGQAVRHWEQQQDWDFVLCIGDDVTDEAMFAALPEPAWTIKVGSPPTSARYQFAQQAEVVSLIRQLVAGK